MEERCDNVEFYFARNNTKAFQSTLERIREENNIRTAFVVQYLFDGDKATAVVPGSAVSQFKKLQLEELSGIN